MPTLIAGIIAVVVIYLALQMLRTVDPAKLARILKLSGGILALAGAAYTGMRGQLAVALPLGFFGLGLLGWAPFDGLGMGRLGAGLPPRLRTDDLELQIDPMTGALDGVVLRGAYAGQRLSALDLAALLSLRASLDAHSRNLLEAYLDRRFAGWRDHMQGDAGGSQKGAFTGGKMTDEEAYQILGLKAGASRSDISRAHRSLMKKLHPDQGGSTYLAARVNEAKETLLRRHRN